MTEQGKLIMKQVAKKRYLSGDHFGFKKNHKPWNKNKDNDLVKAEKNGRWKGDKVKYRPLHDWLRKNYGKPKKCDLCNAIGKINSNGRWTIHWANKDGSYKRERSNWLNLCPSCHNKHDHKGKKYTKLHSVVEYKKLLYQD